MGKFGAFQLLRLFEGSFVSLHVLNIRRHHDEAMEALNTLVDDEYHSSLFYFLVLLPHTHHPFHELFLAQFILDVGK
jgi:hypothetical protein